MATQDFTMSRTMRYKKVMKPLLERKRRARINHCLEELKALMVTQQGRQGQGHNNHEVSKLEKADLLELTVGHLRKLRQERHLRRQDRTSEPQDPCVALERFHAGFRRCVREVDEFFWAGGQQQEEVKHPAASGLLTHLSSCLAAMTSGDKTEPLRLTNFNNHHQASPPASPSQQSQQGLLMECCSEEDEGLDLRVIKKSFNHANESNYDSSYSSDEDMWRPW